LFPGIQALHILGLTVLAGTVVLTDLRLLDIGLRRYAVAELASGLALWTTAGLIAIAITGPLLFWADIPRYTQNPAFILKIVLLAAALAQHFTLHRRAVSSASAPAKQKLAAILSLALWSGVVLAGRAIADFDPPVG
jgi:hypothetical protein